MGDGVGVLQVVELDDGGHVAVGAVVAAGDFVEVIALGYDVGGGPRGGGCCGFRGVPVGWVACGTDAGAAVEAG